MRKRITFTLESNNNRPDERRVRMRVRWGERYSQHNLPHTVNPDKWSKESRRCIPNTTHGRDKVTANTINRLIQKYEDVATSLLLDNPTVEEFKERFNREFGKSSPVVSGRLFDAFDEYVQRRGSHNGWTRRTYQKNAVLRKHLKQFNPSLSFDLTSDDMDSFIDYLTSRTSRLMSGEEGLHNATVERYISMFKWFLRWAREKGYYSGDLHDTYKQRFITPENRIVYLSWSELMRLYSHNFESDSLSQVRDVYCFCAFTSLRYSDVAKLLKSDVQNDRIFVTTQKTNDSLVIELNDFSRSILQKYADSPLRGGVALPVISNQRMNDYLKKIGRILGFDEPFKRTYFIANRRYETTVPKYELLTSHSARRTFVVNALHLGIPAEVVMKWTGHKDFDAMKPYIEIVDELKSSEMEKFNKLSLISERGTEKGQVNEST